MFVVIWSCFCSNSRYCTYNTHAQARLLYESQKYLYIKVINAQVQMFNKTTTCNNLKVCPKGSKCIGNLRTNMYKGREIERKYAHRKIFYGSKAVARLHILLALLVLNSVCSVFSMTYYGLCVYTMNILWILSVC